MKKSTFLYSLVLSFCFTLSNYAAVLNPEEPPEDVPSAPINDYVWILAFAGFIYLFYCLKSNFTTARETK